MPSDWQAGLTPEKTAALRGGFGADAAVYQRTRPVCPPALFDDLMRLAGLAPGDRVLEIAPGTGQATVPLAERGLAVTAVELDPALAALAGTRLATQAGTRELGPAGAAGFLDRVRRRLDEFGSPALTATFVACLTVGLVG
jgi:SAM-dependent methyltransferase